MNGSNAFIVYHAQQTCSRGLSAVVAAHSCVAVASVLMLCLALKRVFTEGVDHALLQLVVCESAYTKQVGESRECARSRKSGRAKLKREKDRAGSKRLREQRPLRRVQTDMLLDER